MRPTPLRVGLALAVYSALIQPRPSVGQSQAGDPALAQLNQRLSTGQTRLEFDRSTGYLRSVLAAFSVPVESQIVVFSKTSLMKQLIGPQNPRALYFNDDIAIGWVRGEPFVEVAATDAREGVVFTVLDQRPDSAPVFRRESSCRVCHEGFSTLAIPRLMVKSIFPAPDGTPIRTLGEFDSTEKSPFRERWGGWYVTGRAGSSPHLGNRVITNPAKRPALKRRYLDSLTAEFETKNYVAPYSDIIALLVFEHQMHIWNLLIRLNLDVQFAQYAKSSTVKGLPDPKEMTATIRDDVNELADALLFIGEEHLGGPIKGTSGFAERFAVLGPHDSRGRSLRQFDLKERLMRYPCSYLLYSKAFDGLPIGAKDAIYKRLWEILSGQDQNQNHRRPVTLDKRKAIVEILRDTKNDLPLYFQRIDR